MNSVDSLPPPSSPTPGLSMRDDTFSGVEPQLARACVELRLARDALGRFRSVLWPWCAASVLLIAGFVLALHGSGLQAYHWLGLAAAAVLGVLLVFWRVKAFFGMRNARRLAKDMQALAPVLRDADALRRMAVGPDDDLAFIARSLLKN